MASNADYWRKRTLERLVLSEVNGDELLSLVLDILAQSAKNIQKDIDSLYTSYSRNGVLDVSELKKTLTPKEFKNFLKKLSITAKEMGLEVTDLYDIRYLGRLKRLQALQEQIKLQIKLAGKKQVDVSATYYSKIIRDNYRILQKDIKVLGVQPSFTQLDNKVISQILKSKWVGGNYSSRIWSNTNDLAKELPKVIGSSINSGQSIKKTVKLLKDRFDVANSDATRLVRTETNYMQNQSELQGYIDDGYTKYKYDAHIDSRTSNICRDLENDIFEISEAEVGVNYPPMHPHCRSTTQVLLTKKSDPTTKYRDRTARFNVGPSNETLFNTNISIGI